MTEPITSATNPRIKRLVRLRTRRERDRSGRFPVEGYRELRRAAAAGITVETLFVCPDLYLGENENALVSDLRSAGTEIVDVSEEAFRKAAYRDRPEGLLGVAATFDVSLDRLDLPPDPLLLVVEAIEKPGNLGTMLRTAEAAGADAVVVADATTDVFNPNVVRASLGTLFTVSLAVATSDESRRFLDDRGIRTVATTPDASTPHTEADLTGPVAVVVGSEQYGLTADWLDGETVVIPMPGSVDSLNAAMAAGIVLFEALRQRTS